MHNDTIAAIATPIGTGGISIIKVSGPEAVASVASIFRPRHPHRIIQKVASQNMIYGHIVDGPQGGVIDEVLVAVLRGPHSFTGEDVVEINCHGGRQVTQAILQILLEGGLRLADPGEFTRRAFLNGRIDLTQVEGTIDLINAQSRRAARLGSYLIDDGLGRPLRKMRSIVMETRAQIEAAIDFCDEDETEISADSIKMGLQRDLLPALNTLIDAFTAGDRVRHGLRIVLAGKPNVGKSSLMNQLLGRERVIVTQVPGTTRDAVEESFEIEGLPIVLTDTAGLRDSDDPIERIGQEKAHRAIKGADLVLLMIDASQPLDDADLGLVRKLKNDPCLIVRNKVDLIPDPEQRATLEEEPNDGYIDISALHGQGLDGLKESILATAGLDRRDEADGCIPNLRQKDLLVKARRALSNILDMPSGRAALETMAIDIKDCERYFNQILGDDVEPDVLDAIFQRFCIGK
jgi:tRNA modification GTPase